MQIETEKEAGDKRIHDRISHLTDIQQQETRNPIEKIESSINELKISLNGAVNDLHC
jgi:polyhydroxyalkanoate synthesis regulator phasin